MANMTLTKTPMPEQEPQVRAHNFKEVALGYTAEMAMEEAGRCLNCKQAQVRGGLPRQRPHPRVHRQGAPRAISRPLTRSLRPPTPCPPCPAVSARRRASVRASASGASRASRVAIGRLERFVADWYRENVNAMPEKAVSNGIKVAVVGSGPAGLTCASDLAKKGYQVSIFEALHTAGGVLVYGIPEFRLPKAIVANEVEEAGSAGRRGHDQHGHRPGPDH